MNSHQRHGFQRTFTNDVFHVEEQLQAYDEHLYVMWNPNTGQHLVMDGLLELAVMRIPQMGFPELNSKIVDRMKQIHTINGFSATAEVMAGDAAREKEWMRRTDDMAENFGRDTAKAAKKIAYYQ